ncbi:MAG: metallophosphoesterase family protein [Acidobacteriaceae bacterium]
MSNILLKGLIAISLISFQCTEIWAQTTSASNSPTLASDIPAGDTKPWNKVPALATGPNFSFTMFSDRTSFAYPRGLEHAFRTLNDERARSGFEPAFILSVGDNIEGLTHDLPTLKAMWAGFDAVVNKSPIPFIPVPGNHDVFNNTLRQLYLERYGRDYFYFVYDHVLFLGLDTDEATPPLTKEREQAIETMLGNAGKQAALHPDLPLSMGGTARFCGEEKSVGPHAANYISDRQEAYFEKVIDQHPDVSWIFVYMHRPAWKSPDRHIFEKLQHKLAGHKYTVFAGHLHDYSHELIDGHDYFVLGPTATIPVCIGPQGLDQYMDVRFVDGVPHYVVRMVNQAQ